MTNYDILNIGGFLEQVQSKKYPQKVLFAIIKNIKILNKEREVYQDSLKQLFDRYGEDFAKNENGEVIYSQNGFPQIDDEEKNKEFYDEINELLGIKTDIELYKIDEELLNYDPADKYDVLSGDELFNLMTILCEDKKED